MINPGTTDFLITEKKVLLKCMLYVGKKCYVSEVYQLFWKCAVGYVEHFILCSHKSICLLLFFFFSIPNDDLMYHSGNKSNHVAKSNYS